MGHRTQHAPSTPPDPLPLGDTQEVSTTDESLHPEICPYEIHRPTMRMQWEDLTFLHWRFEPDQVQRLLPRSVTVETFDGAAWVGLVPFQMRVDVPLLPAWPRLLHFPETNVRTYVTDQQGRPGVWFFSLEASSLAAVLTARAGYRVPYTWAEMEIDRHNPTGALTGRQFSYRSKRRWPKPRGASSLVEVTVDRAFEAGEAGGLDRFLTARWALYSPLGPFLIRAEMHHEPWPLFHATVDRLDDELIAACGLPQPEGEPLVHFSPQVSVRCGWPRGRFRRPAAAGRAEPGHQPPPIGSDRSSRDQL